MTIRRLLFSAALVALAFSSACDLFNKTSAQVSAKKVIVGTMLHTPPIVVRPEAIAGFDASFPFFDGGFPFSDGGFSFDGGFAFDGGFPGDGGFSFDAGGFVFDTDGGFSITVPEQTVVFGYFGTRNGEGLSQELDKERRRAA